MRSINIFSLKDDKEIRIVLFKSTNPLFFSAHLDMTVINGSSEGQAACIEFCHMIKNLKTLKPLSVAIIDGLARGGGDEFVMACDLAYATENAVFAQPEITANIPTGGQGSVQYARRMGRSKALHALLLSPDFTAQEAETLKIITKFVPKAEMDNFIEQQLLPALKRLEIRNIVMCKEIITASIIDEDAGIVLELKYFWTGLEKRKHRKLLTHS